MIHLLVTATLSRWKRSLITKERVEISNTVLYWSSGTIKIAPIQKASYFTEPSFFFFSLIGAIYTKWKSRRNSLWFRMCYTVIKFLFSTVIRQWNLRKGQLRAKEMNRCLSFSPPFRQRIVAYFSSFNSRSIDQIFGFDLERLVLLPLSFLELEELRLGFQTWAKRKSLLPALPSNKWQTTASDRTVERATLFTLTRICGENALIWRLVRQVREK